MVGEELRNACGRQGRLDIFLLAKFQEACRSIVGVRDGLFGGGWRLRGRLLVGSDCRAATFFNFVRAGQDFPTLTALLRVLDFGTAIAGMSIGPNLTNHPLPSRDVESDERADDVSRDACS